LRRGVGCPSGAGNGLVSTIDAGADGQSSATKLQLLLRIEYDNSSQEFFITAELE
jgi:hypothetical protein